MNLIVITGGIGTGKSAVLAQFRALGGAGLDTDDVAHELYAPNGPAWRAIANHFGHAIVRADGQLDRKAIARRVFAAPLELAWLNGLLHPLIRERLLAEADFVAPRPLFAAVPLWYEIGWELPGVRVIATWCTTALQLERLYARGWSEEEIARRLKNQLPKDEKLNRADYAILTIGSMNDLHEQCARLYEAI